MDEIINVSVRIENEEMVTDSRNIAEVFEKRHDHVLRDISDLKKDISNFGEMFIEGEMPDSYGRKQKVYFLNRDGFSLLAMGFTGSKATEWKLKYINAFNELEKAWNTPEQIMSRALKIADRTINSLKIENSIMKPKAEFFDAVAESKDAVSMTDVAKVIGHKGMGRNNLFEFLRNKKVLDNHNQPYQRYVDAGYFRVIEQSFYRDVEQCINFKTLVYQKGLDYIRKLLEESGKEH